MSSPSAPCTPPAPPTPHVCARCARCCVVHPGEETLLFPLFEEEIARLRAASPGSEPVESVPTTPALQEAMLRLFPDEADQVRALLPVPGTHHRLAVAEGQACIFLGTHGCRLPRDVRPAHCLLFPFWFHRRRLRVLEARDCLAIREAGTVWRLLQSLELKEDSLREAFARLRRLWGLPPE